MKLKGLLKGLCILGLTLLPIYFSNADYFYLNDSSTINDGIGTNVFTLKSNANLDTEGVKVFQIQGRGNYPRLHTLFWNGSGLYHIVSCQGGYDCQNIHTSIKEQGFYTRYCETTYDNTCTNLDTDISNFLNDDTLSNPDRLYVKNLSSTDELQYFTMCFQYSGLNKSICFYSDNSTEVLYNSLGLTNNPYVGDMDSTFLSLLTNSPFISSTTPTINVNVGACPTVGQVLATSDLVPAVCYAGYDSNLIYSAGEDTPIQFGSGLTIFETYELFSGNMTIQNWYDTYWNYYQDISFNPYPFYGKPKALLGIETARQIVGRSLGYKGSYAILNYCYYYLGDFSPNSSTCVVSKVDTVYSGITITNQDRQDLIDALNDDYDIRTPGSGSIYDVVWQGSGGGATSWGDDCSGIACLFNKFYDMFNSSVITDVDFSSYGMGVLPSYIGLAFVVVVLFYVFKR